MSDDLPDATAGGSDEPGRARIEILADDDRPGGYVLLLEWVRQSYVDLDDPTYLDFEYMRWMAHVLDGRPDGPVNVTHIGGGAGTMARYVAHVRPGSSQIVLEPDVELTALVRARLPFARTARVRIRPVDGRSGLAGLADDSADVMILDAFAGARVPADLTTAQACAQYARVLRPDGVLLANLGDGGGLDYTRRFVAGLRTVLPHVGVVTEKQVLSGRRFGNVVVVAGAGPLELDDLRRALAREPFPAQCISDEPMRRWLGSATAFTDDAGRRSPAPPFDSWRVQLDT